MYEEFGGLALEEEGKRCAGMLGVPKTKTMIMGNHGVLGRGETVADTFNRLYYFERTAQTYVRALQTASLRAFSVRSPKNRLGAGRLS